MRNDKRWACVVVVASLVAPPARATGQEPASFRCQVMAFSPAVATDRTGLCVTLDYQPGTVTPDGNASVYRTTDLGRTWQRRKADGLRPLLSNSLEQLVFSPEYATDRAVYLHAYGRGLLRSVDGGDTWLPVSPATDSAVTTRNLTPVRSIEAGSVVRAAALAFASEAPALVSPPLHLPVAGAPGIDLQFLADGTTGATFVASLDTDVEVEGTRVRTRLYECDVALTCHIRLGELPAGHDWQDGWLAPDFASSGTIYAVSVEGNGAVHAWRSPDRGATFTRWTGLDRFLRPITNAAATIVVIAARPGLRQMYARVSHVPFPRHGPVQPAPPAPPGEQVLRSDDSGRTWHRVAYGLAFGQRGRPGSLPWDDAGMGPDSALGFELLPDGSLMTVAARFPVWSGPFRSRDGGRSWSRAIFS